MDRKQLKLLNYKSLHGVIQKALRLLRTSQLADDYASAWTEWTEEDARTWDRTAADGIAE